MAAWSDHPCDYCSGGGCVLCHEPHPSETWSFFTDQDLIQLLADTAMELGRRDQKIQVMVS